MYSVQCVCVVLHWSETCIETIDMWSECGVGGGGGAHVLHAWKLGHRVGDASFSPVATYFQAVKLAICASYVHTKLATLTGMLNLTE